MTHKIYTEQFLNTYSLVVITEDEQKVQFFSPKSAFGIDINEEWLNLDFLMSFIHDSSKKKLKKFIDQKLTIKNFNCKKTIISIMHYQLGKIDCLLEGIDGMAEESTPVIILKFTLLPEAHQNFLQQSDEFAKNSKLIKLIQQIYQLYIETNEYHLFLMQVNSLLNEQLKDADYVFNFDEIEQYNDYLFEKELLFGKLSVYRLFLKRKSDTNSNKKLFNEIMPFVDLCALALFKDDVIIKSKVEMENEKLDEVAHLLHDNICQHLASISLQVGKYAFIAQQDDNDDLLNIKNEINVIIDDIRNISKNIMPKAIDEFGFMQSLHAFFIEKDNEGSINFKLETDVKEFKYSTQKAVYSIIIGLIQFIQKTSTAQSVITQMGIQNEILEFKIKEKNAKYITNISTDPSYIDIKTQILKLNGTITLNSIPQSGTYYNIKIPL